MLFNFIESSLLLSPPGIFRLCFCRQSGEVVCETPQAFRAPLGLMTAAGPFQQTTTCIVGGSCTVQLSGIDLHPEDVLLVSETLCEAVASFTSKGLRLKQPLSLQAEGAALQALLGSLPPDTTPGTYQLCWCPANHACTSPASFRAAAGQLQLNCPEGHFFADSRSVPCGRGFYCPGGSPGSALRFPCPEHETTDHGLASTRSQCACMAGYFLDSGRCTACDQGCYKAEVGNALECDDCPDNLTTLLTGSVSSDSCIAVADEGSSPDVDLAASLINSSDVSALTFNISLGTDWVDPSLKPQLLATLRRSIADSTNMDSNSIEVILPWADATGRRLGEFPPVVIRLKFSSMAEANRSVQETDVRVLVSDMDNALKQNARLSGFIVETESTPTVLSVTVMCPSFSAKPPGVPILSEIDCLCIPGFGFDEQLGTCIACPLGEFKSTLADTECQKCPTSKSTLELGAVSVQQCKCGGGLHEEGGVCTSCEVGFYCTGTGYAERCPPNSTTISHGARTATECLCTAGYQAQGPWEASQQATLCDPCPSGRYKSTLGNGVCFQACPSNADSEPASTAVDDCYCIHGYVAELDSTGKLDRCSSCALYRGLVCTGGFIAGTTNHSMPRAIQGWYQSGITQAAECHVALPTGESVCTGFAWRCQYDPSLKGCGDRFGNECAEGSSGMLCGECPEGWGRSSSLQYCQPCAQDPNQRAALLSASILVDLSRITFVNFVIAALAAKGAGTSLKLHTSMIRILQAWVAACSILLSFNLNQLEPFSWSQEQDQDGAECDGDCQQLFKFAWPQEVSDAMQFLLSLTAIIPQASVAFGAECQAEVLVPGSFAAKQIAPALYYFCVPLLALVGTVMICAVVAYILVPLGNVLGFHFNDA